MRSPVELFDTTATPARETPHPGVHMRAIFGDQLMLNIVELAPGAALPLHSHPQEQLGLVLQGTLILECDGVEHRIEEMQAYVVPSDVPHAGTGGPSGCIVADAFTPVREDFRSFAVAGEPLQD
jgi:quercetin dioxygenase-like cupin family protein